MTSSTGSTPAAPQRSEGPTPRNRREVLVAGAAVAGAALAAGAAFTGAAALGGCASGSGRAPRAEPDAGSALPPSSPNEAPGHAPEDTPAARDAGSDDPFDDLTDQRGTAAPIREDERGVRRQRLGKILSTGGEADALLIEGGATLTYLTGVSWGHSERFFGLVVTASGEHFWICPAFEESRARQKIDGDGRPGGAVVAWQEDEYFQKPLAAELARRGIRRIAIEPSLRTIFVERLASEVGRDHVVSGQATVVALRGVKDAHEIELLRRANELTQSAIRRVAQAVRPGMSGNEIAAMMGHAHEKLGMQSPWCLALIGPAAALPHGEQHDLRLKRGDVLLVDTGASFHGYQSDNTRTWVFDGAPSNEVERVWNIVRDAQLRAFEGIRPGVVCGDIDRAARELIAERGFGPGYAKFTHRLGHGIGLEGHEDPYFDSGSRVALAAGMTLSDEPGIYLPGQFGVRLEDIVVVTEQGADHFGQWQARPTSPE